MKLQDYLDELVGLEGVQGALISLKNGLLAASSFTGDADENALAATAAAVFDAMNRHFIEAGLGEVVDTIIETSSYSIQIVGANDLILVVFAEKRMNVKEIRLHMRRTAIELAERDQS